MRKNRLHESDQIRNPFNTTATDRTTKMKSNTKFVPIPML